MMKNDHESYNLIKQIFEENGTKELIKGVFITEKDNAVVEIMVNFQELRKYQGLGKVVKTCKTLHVSDISDMMPLLDNL